MSYLAQCVLSGLIVKCVLSDPGVKCVLSGPGVKCVLSGPSVKCVLFGTVMVLGTIVVVLGEGFLSPSIQSKEDAWTGRMLVQHSV